MSILEAKRMKRIFIDGQDFVSGEGESVLQVARRYRLSSIPSLCYHPALRAGAACRMCVVEVEGAKTELTTACTLAVEEGLRVLTDTETVRHSRRNTVSLLLKNAPESPLLQSWAGKYQLDNIEVTGTTVESFSGCISCGLCVKACEALGIEAIQFLGKGPDRQVKLVLEAGRSDCIGCQACKWLCTRLGMHNEGRGGVQELEAWISHQPEAICAGCGKTFATQAAINFVQSRVPATRARIHFCPQCKRIASIPRHLRG
jgi:bidirectional [NiFe] hydrogenase diaphorase subunit